MVFARHFTDGQLAELISGQMHVYSMVIWLIWVRQNVQYIDIYKIIYIYIYIYSVLLVFSIFGQMSVQSNVCQMFLGELVRLPHVLAAVYIIRSFSVRALLDIKLIR